MYTKHNDGAASSRNLAFLLSKGDYIQWLDADDLLAPDKITLQMGSLRPHHSKRVLLSSAWGRFIYRYNRRSSFRPRCGAIFPVGVVVAQDGGQPLHADRFVAWLVAN